MHTTNLITPDDRREIAEARALASWQPALERAGVPAALARVAQMSAEGATVYPLEPNVLRAFELTAFDRVRVVVLGQDPYHDTARCRSCAGRGWTGRSSVLRCTDCSGSGQVIKATGLAFSAPRNAPIPPSLRVIFDELTRSAPPCPRCDEGRAQDVWGHRCEWCGGSSNAWGWQRPKSPNLEPWARRGVLLVNAALTVEAGSPAGHATLWRPVVRDVLRALWRQRRGIVWLTWGRYARLLWSDVAEMPVLTERDRGEMGDHLVLTAPHPSPMAHGLIGCDHFTQVRDWQAARGEEPIDWRLDG